MGIALPAQSASAAIGQCPPGEIQSPTNSPIDVFSDNGVAVFSGGDMRIVEGRAELEGFVIAGGDFRSERSGGRLNLGWVGVGSGVVPDPVGTLLRVGGALVVDGGILDVGSAAMNPSQNSLGGNVAVGGSVSPSYPSAAFELNNGSLQSGLGGGALGEFGDYASRLSDATAAMAAEAATGSVATSPGELRFTGSGAAQEVFAVTAEQLNAGGSVFFEGIADGASVIVNVTRGSVHWVPNYFADNCARADVIGGAVNGFGKLSSRTIWNIADASEVTIGGSSQVLGSIVVPNEQSTKKVTASTDGRLLVGGELILGGSGAEHHNYPSAHRHFACVPVVPGAPGSDDPSDSAVSGGTPAGDGDSSRGSDRALSVTGAESAMPLLAASLASVALGGGAVLVARRRAASRDEA